MAVMHPRPTYNLYQCAKSVAYISKTGRYQALARGGARYLPYLIALFQLYAFREI